MRISSWLKNWKTTPRNRNKSQTALVAAEQMEPRTLLSASALIIAGELNVSLHTNENVQVSTFNGNLLVQTSSGTGLFTPITSLGTVAASSITSIVINGGDQENIIDLGGVLAADFTKLPSIKVNSGNGNDTITGSPDLPDSLSGGDGNDLINSQGGNDTVDGGDGRDTINAGTGDDNILAGDGADVVDGGSGNDTISGGNGADTITSGAGNDSVSGNNGEDSITGDAGDDTINSDGGTDFVSGGTGNDSILGGELNDVLQGDDGTDTIEGAHAAVGQTLGPAVALLFAVGLLASGLASASVGAYAGAMIMQGLLRRSYPALVRRLVTLVPALAVLASGVDPTRALVLSQVVLSFGIPFALVPLMRLTANRDVMGDDANSTLTSVLGWSVAGVITALNVALIYLTIF